MTVTGPQDTTGRPKTLRVLLAEAEARDRIPVPQGGSDSEPVDLSKATPRPWENAGRYIHAVAPKANDRGFVNIAICSGYQSDVMDERHGAEANAALIVAAVNAYQVPPVPQGASGETDPAIREAETPKCAHLEVAWNQEPVHDDDGYYLHHTGWWACVGCGTKFTVASVITDLQEALSAEFLESVMLHSANGEAARKAIFERLGRGE